MNVHIFVTIGSNSSTIIHSSLELNVLEVIRKVIVPLVNHSVDDTLAVLSICPSESLTIVVKAVPQLPRGKVAIGQVTIGISC